MRFLRYIASYFGTTTTTARIKQWSKAQIGAAVLEAWPDINLPHPAILEAVEDHHALTEALRASAAEPEEGDGL